MFSLAGSAGNRYEKGRHCTSAAKWGPRSVRLEGRGDGGRPQVIEAPAAIGFEESSRALDGATYRRGSRDTLTISADEFLALLSENVELAEGIFRMLIESHRLTAGKTLMHGTLPPEVKDAANLRPVDNLLLLQASPLLAHATAAQLWRLSGIARERTIAANSEALAKGGEAAILVVLSGALRVEEQGTATPATDRDLRTLAGNAA